MKFNLVKLKQHRTMILLLISDLIYLSCITYALASYLDTQRPEFYLYVSIMILCTIGNTNLIVKLKHCKLTKVLDSVLAYFIITLLLVYAISAM